MRNNFYYEYLHLVLFILSIFLLRLEITTTIAISHHPVAAVGAGNYKCMDKERHALLDFKACIDQDPYGFLSTWTTEDRTTNDCCKWIGVTCNNQTGHVIRLHLVDGDLEGKISPSLLDLIHLNYLNLFGNSFNGTIPMFIGSMTQLRYLDLGSNLFSGIVPPELGNLTNLKEFSLQDLRRCTIENLDWLSHLSNLETLDMSGISLAKEIHWVNAILRLHKLSHLSLDRCDLSHFVRTNSYSYSKSSSYSSIVTLSLAGNNLNSSMYHWLFPLTSNRLVDLDLSHNKLDKIPKYLGSLCSLTFLHIAYNTMPAKFPDFLDNLSGCTSATLQWLDASSSQFTGSLSDEIRKFSSLQTLDLSHNQLNGTISEKVWQLPSLQLLLVSSNSLKGHNNLSGRLPSSIEYLLNLEVPDLVDQSEGVGEATDEFERSLYIGGASGFATGFWIVCGALLVNRRGRKAFFRVMDSLKDWFYIKVMVFTANWQRATHA
ncbi:hypothetical protein L1987_67403 [Smallanthus sonchifolius]|uniref:Uncharacterized protein n=1 Tax=Smallanthus sonchifolius TaxID=185202 RepID=A0ACB9B1W6_9ASTR|nr:hypothetical protein L1987_67403 [Smallanthus sonchifolius]